MQQPVGWNGFAIAALGLSMVSLPLIALGVRDRRGLGVAVAAFLLVLPGWPTAAFLLW
ncbi:hypothetical protein ACIRPT_26530 [Streptomyces sp. NPDC101227]|uniref:hypothetical protein n=1 Tax=Streptomyces sp. NPDC101227 TaxID=3366136 RepID=UPI00381585F7